MEAREKSEAHRLIKKQRLNALAPLEVFTTVGRERVVVPVLPSGLEKKGKQNVHLVVV